jgi:ATP-dependent DNA ligase
MSDASDSGTRHLALIFFDILVLDSVSLLFNSYSSRRSKLESIIRTRPGYILLAERTPIVLNGSHNIGGACNQLRAIWARVIAECEEGLVLKADEGAYNDYRSPWVKVRGSCSCSVKIPVANRYAAQERLYSGLRRYCRSCYYSCFVGQESCQRATW